jgi:DNA-binding NtrC family response regulator
MDTEMREPDDSSIKILIVDDDRTIADVLCDLVSDTARRVDVRYDGVTALEAIQKTPYDLILVDLVMPRMGGLDVLKFAKKSNPDVVVIIITGYASLETAITAVKEGAYDYIRKPWKLEEIKIVVENAVDKIQLYRENNKLVKQLQDAYGELLALKKGTEAKDESIAKINFFPSNIPSFHYLYSDNGAGSSHIDKLQALSSLRENGMLTEEEFKDFKRHLLKAITHKT